MASAAPQRAAAWPALAGVSAVPTWLYLPSLMSFCLLRNQSGILYWRGFCMMVTTLSTCGHRRQRSHVRTPHRPPPEASHLSTIVGVR